MATTLYKTATGTVTATWDSNNSTYKGTIPVAVSGKLITVLLKGNGSFIHTAYPDGGYGNQGIWCDVDGNGHLVRCVGNSYPLYGVTYMNGVGNYKTAGSRAINMTKNANNISFTYGSVHVQEQSGVDST